MSPAEFLGKVVVLEAGGGGDSPERRTLPYPKPRDYPPDRTRPAQLHPRQGKGGIYTFEADDFDLCNTASLP